MQSCCWKINGNKRKNCFIKVENCRKVRKIQADRDSDFTAREGKINIFVSLCAFPFDR